MDLNTLASIGEFAGAIAVVVSVLYLAIQIRQNSKTVRAAALQTVNDTSIRALSGMAAPGTAEVLVKGREELSSLTPTEAFQFSTHVSIMMIGFQGTFYQFKAGLIPEPVWRRNLLVMRWWAAFKGIRQAMNFMAPTFDPEFVALLKPPSSSVPDPTSDRPTSAE